MENEIQKPLSVAKVELVNKLTTAINESGVPLILVEYILKDLASQVQTLNTQQLQEDNKKYADQIKAQESKE